MLAQGMLAEYEWMLLSLNQGGVEELLGFILFLNKMHD